MQDEQWRLGRQSNGMGACEKMKNENFPPSTANICPICGFGEHTTLYKNLKDCWLGSPGNWSLYTCKSCGLAYLYPPPTSEEIRRAYSKYFTHQVPITTTGKTGNESLSSWLIPRLKKSYRWALRGVTQKRDEMHNMYISHLTPGRLLDVGCGNGMFLKRMRDLGWSVEGVDTDPQSAKAADEAYGIAIHTGTLQNARFPENHFDSITMSHVIEHVLDPLPILAESRRILRPGGVLVIATPNVQSMGHHLFRRKWLGLDPPRHLCLFCRKSLELLVRRAGFMHPQTHTSAARADMIFTDMMRVQTGRLDGTLRRGWHLYSQVFLLLELSAILWAPNAGEDLILRTRK